MSGTWPHDLLAVVGILLVAGGFVWAGLPRRHRRRR